MTTRRVLLGGTGTSGDGSTWGTGDGGTNAYKGMAGLVAAIAASTGAGDKVLFTGSTSVTSSLLIDDLATSLTRVARPPRCYGMQSASDTDYVPGLATGAAGFAFDHANVPTITITGNGNAIHIERDLYIYGLKVTCEDAIYIAYHDNASYTELEECWIGSSATGDFFRINSWRGGPEVVLRNTKLAHESNGSSAQLGNFTMLGGIIDSDAGGLIRPGYNSQCIHIENVDFQGTQTAGLVDLSGGAAGAKVLIKNCKKPNVSNATTDTPSGRCRAVFENVSHATSITDSVQAYEIQSERGQIVVETTKVMTGGSTDGAKGTFSLAFNPDSGATRAAEDDAALWCRLAVWVAGDGTSKTITLNFASDSANTETGDWHDDHAWAYGRHGDDAGSALYDIQKKKMDLGGTSAAVADDTTSTWATGTQNPQKIEFTAAPDYEGYFYVDFFFAPTDADTIYLNGDLAVS